MPAQTHTWWQLRAGEVMWQSHHVMLRDEFSHTVSGGYWPNQRVAGAGTVLWRVQGRGSAAADGTGRRGRHICWAVVGSLTPAPRGVRLVLLGAGAVMTSPAWSLRPQVFSLALVAITLSGSSSPAPSLDARARVRRLGKSPWWRLAWSSPAGAALVSTLIVRPTEFRQDGDRCRRRPALHCGDAAWIHSVGRGPDVARAPARLRRLMEWQRPGLDWWTCRSGSLHSRSW